MKKRVKKQMMIGTGFIARLNGHDKPHEYNYVCDLIPKCKPITTLREEQSKGGREMTIDDAKRQIEAQKNLIEDLSNKLAEAEKKIEGMQNVLKFYANPVRYVSSEMNMCGHPGKHEITIDNGRRARKALGEE